MHILRLLAVTLLPFGLALAPAARAAAPDPARAPIVILISVDGLSADNFRDSTVDIPTIRWMAQHGAQAERMQTVFPSVTWPTHTTLVTGVSPGIHGVLGNAYFDRQQRKKIPLLPDPLFDKEEIVKVPTIYDVAQRAGFKTAGVNWPASRNAKHLDWQAPDVGDQAIYERSITPSLLAEFRAKKFPIEKQGEWAKAGNLGKPQRDWLYTRMAQHILSSHRPNVLVIHFVTVDAFAHSNGTNSVEVRWAANDTDNRIRELLETVKSAGLADRTTFIISSDHGFTNYTQHVNLNALLRAKGLMRSLTDRQVAFVAEGGAGSLYILDTANRAKILAELLPELRKTEGIESVITSSEFAAVGHRTPEQNPHEPDILLSATVGYAFSENATKDLITPAGGTKGTHGTSPKNQLLDATFVAWGAAIKPGTKLAKIRNVDVAPTMAAILGLKMENVEGRPLTEILK